MIERTFARIRWHASHNAYSSMIKRDPYIVPLSLIRYAISESALRRPRRTVSFPLCRPHLRHSIHTLFHCASMYEVRFTVVKVSLYVNRFSLLRCLSKRKSSSLRFSALFSPFRARYSPIPRTCSFRGCLVRRHRETPFDWDHPSASISEEAFAAE